MFRTPKEEFRVVRGSMSSSKEIDGKCGAWIIPTGQRKGEFFHVISSNATAWEHVSVKIFRKGNTRIPTWLEMCKVKDMFWDKDDVAFQFHPAKENHVSIHDDVLHLWRPKHQTIPMPPLEMV